MAINNTKVKDMLDSGMDKDLFEDAEESLPREICFSGSDEEVFDFATESEIDLVETIQGASGSRSSGGRPDPE